MTNRMVGVCMQNYEKNARSQTDTATKSLLIAKTP